MHAHSASSVSHAGTQTKQQNGCPVPDPGAAVTTSKLYAYNTANGCEALSSNTTGNYNTANGCEALSSNTTGYENTANGYWALYYNTTGYDNTADGVGALSSNTTGYANTADGYWALSSNTTGTCNMANGAGALSDNIDGNNNTANGVGALSSNTTGDYNIAIGYLAGYNLDTGSNNIYIGNGGTATDNDVIWIGTQGTQTQTFVAGIYGAAVTGSAVVVNSRGQLGVAPSSKRFKRDIQDMGSASEAILALRPVTFHYNQDIDPNGTPQFGLVAEEVEKISPDLVVRDASHQVYTVRYDAVNAMLLNEFRKQHERVEEQAKIIAEQKKEIAALAARQNDYAALAARLDALEKASASK